MCQNLGFQKEYIPSPSHNHTDQPRSPMPHQSVAEQQSPPPSKPSALSTDRVLEGIGKQEEPTAQGRATGTLFVFGCGCVNVFFARSNVHPRMQVPVVTVCIKSKVRFFFMSSYRTRVENNLLFFFSLDIYRLHTALIFRASKHGTC